MTPHTRTDIFRSLAPQYWGKGMSATPVKIGTKGAMIKGWANYSYSLPNGDTRADWLERYGGQAIGICLGTPIAPTHVLIAIDVDDERWVAVTDAIIGPSECSKRGQKGKTIFVKAPSSDKPKTTRIAEANGKPAIDVLGPKSMTVLPPSPHPKGIEYVWIGKSLLEDPELPEFTARHLRILKAVVSSKEAVIILSGDGTHDAFLRLSAKLVAAGADDDEIVAICTALLPPNYKGNSLEELPELIASARRKGFGQAGASKNERGYEPDAEGPIPLGYAGSEFVFRHQQTKEVVKRVSFQLLSAPGLFELASKEFWESKFGKIDKHGRVYGIDYVSAGNALIQACRAAGAIDASSIRGIGVWPEDGRLVVNLGGEVILSNKFIYTTPKPLVLNRSPVPFDTIIEFLRKPNWTSASVPEMLLGWAVTSVLCGALPWRPHAGVTGPAQGGKSTILRAMGEILSPLVIVREGISTEAGIRQAIGNDARPVILDELEAESGQDRGRVARIIKLMRSSSSATGGVARGTPEGKAISFNTRAMFLIGAINLQRNSAADTSRQLRFELAKIDTEQGRRSHQEVVQLLERLTGIGPAFCQYVIDHATDVLSSQPLIHRTIPAVQERQADNLATVLAGYWVAFNGRPINQQEAEKLVDEHVAAIDEQKEGVELDDATECLNSLLGFTVTQTITDDTDNGPRTRREPVVLGTVIANAIANKPHEVGLLDQLGIRVEDGGFIVANSHPGLRKVYRDTRWEGGMWSSALSRLEGAVKTSQKRFSDGVRSMAVWIPAEHVPYVEPGTPI
jgi:hypothetical protein